MDDSHVFQREGVSEVSSRTPRGEDLLPPVEPPSAKFIVQLFVVPALIVLVIFGLFVAFNWLVRRTSMGPEQLIQGLEQGPSIARWQRASDLAFLLPNERYAEFRRQGEPAAHLGRILNREIDSGGMTEGEIAMRFYLVGALGKFEVTEGLDALIRAAETNRDPAERLVRYAALEEIARRAYNMSRHTPPRTLASPELEPALMRLAADEDPLIRGRTVYVLGKLGTPAAIKRLEVMTDDADASTRFDAAVALAHRGNDNAVATLAEMLDVDELVEATPPKEGGDSLKRSVIVASAIEAVNELVRQNPGANLSAVEESLAKLAAADSDELAKAQIPPRAIADAKNALEFLKSKQAETTPVKE
jgi:hypothetical protein